MNDDKLIIILLTINFILSFFIVHIFAEKSYNEYKNDCDTINGTIVNDNTGDIGFVKCNKGNLSSFKGFGGLGIMMSEFSIIFVLLFIEILIYRKVRSL